MKFRNQIIILIAIMFPLAIAWWPFSFIEGRVDLFLFIDFEQKPQWYALDTSFYLKEIFMAYIIHVLVKAKYPYLKTLTGFYLIFATLRLVSYWCFRDQIPLMLPIGAALIYSSHLLVKLWDK